MDLMRTAALLGNIGEFIGAIAVLITLIYLTIQLRQNTKAIRNQGLQSSTNETRRWVAHFVDSPEVAELYLKGQEGLDELTKHERLRFTMLIFELCTIWATYQEHSPEDLFGLTGSAEGMIATWTQQGWFPVFWERNQFAFAGHFREFVWGIVNQSASRS